MPSVPRLTQALDDFKLALQARRPAQAYLVVADVRGEGREFAARALGQHFCEGADKPCDQCPECRRVRTHTHPDIAWIEPELKSRIVGIERIRDLGRLIFQTSYSGGWKACVLVSADRLGEGASNAFLKTLEEPPPRCIFFLLTDAPQALLPTIVSRCQRIVLAAEPVALPEPWQGRLLAILTAPFDRSFVARLGRAAQFLRLLKEMRAAIDAEEQEREDETGPEADKETRDARVEARYRERRGILLRAMLLWYRDILLCVCGCDAALYHYGESRARLAQAAGGLTYPEAYLNVQVVEELQRQLGRNLTVETVFNFAVTRMTA